MPFAVRESCPSRNALLLFGIEPRQRTGNERLVELLRVLERGDRFRAVDDDVVLGVDELAAVRPDEPMRPARVAGCVAEGEARGRALGLERLAQLQESAEVARDGIEARGLDLALAIDDGIARGAHHDGDPLVAVHAVVLGDRIPAAVLVAQVVREVGDVDELLGILVRVLHRADDHVRPTAHVGGNRGLRAHVFPPFGVDAHGNARHLGELLRVRGPHVLVALHEALPAQHPERGALFRRHLVRLRGRIRRPQRASPEGRARGDAGSGLQKIATTRITHVASPPRWLNHAAMRTPLSASNTCARGTSGTSAIRSPARAATRSRTIAVTSCPLNLQ